MSELLALGVSHKTAPVGLRERVALTDTGALELLSGLLADESVHEAVAISTCNRTEVYLVAGDPVEAETAVLGMLARRAGTRPTELAPAIYSLRNCDAARHLFRVTAGLESMIIGEAEVQGQVRRAYELALGAGATGPLTNRVFRAALATGKRARSETAIGEGATNVPAVAVRLARDILGELDGRRVIVLGTGDTGELTAAALAGQGARTVFVANRRRERADSLARRFGGRVVGFDDFPTELGTPTSWSPPPPPRTRSWERRSWDRDDGAERRPLLLIDIAVPRDVEPACAAVKAPPSTTSTTCRPSSPVTAGPRGRGRARRGDRRAGDPALRALARLAGGAARPSRPSRPGQGRSSSGCSPRTPGAGRRCPSATSTASHWWREPWQAACCTSRRCAQGRPRDRAHARRRTSSPSCSRSTTGARTSTGA